MVSWWGILWIALALVALLAIVVGVVILVFLLSNKRKGDEK